VHGFIPTTALGAEFLNSCRRFYAGVNHSSIGSATRVCGMEGFNMIGAVGFNVGALQS
jgi:hypothetical protein